MTYEWGHRSVALPIDEQSSDNRGGHGRSHWSEPLPPEKIRTHARLRMKTPQAFYVTARCTAALAHCCAYMHLVGVKEQRCDGIRVARKLEHLRSPRPRVPHPHRAASKEKWAREAWCVAQQKQRSVAAINRAESSRHVENGQTRTTKHTQRSDRFLGVLG